MGNSQDSVDESGETDEGEDEGEDDEGDQEQIQLLSNHLEQERYERQKLIKTFDTFKSKHKQLLKHKQKEIENLKKQLKIYAGQEKRKRKHSMLEMLHISD